MSYGGSEWLCITSGVDEVIRFSGLILAQDADGSLVS